MLLNYYFICKMSLRHFRTLFHKPELNFFIALLSISICIIPKFFGYKDSFNRPDSNDIFDVESMKTSALLLLLSASPTLLDFAFDFLFGSQDKLPELKRSRVAAALSYTLVSLDILSKLGYFPVHITSTKFHLSFEFLVWCIRLSTTASLMFATSTRNPVLFPVWQTSIATLSVASYGLLRYVVPLEGVLGGVLYYNIILTTRIFLVSCVHYFFCVWVHSFLIIRKWTMNDYCVLFYVLIFTFLTLDFVSNTVYVVIANYAYSNVVNMDRLRVERSIISLVISQVMFSVIPGRLAKIEMMQLKVKSLNNLCFNLIIYLYDIYHCRTLC